ncbi:MAG TPA: 4Fe-4S dicluster domain-containing protein [Armatimonadota bacterium]|nr:4Fe-4S dicluster domain-containing protein [Armatimonadota bacterium]
MLQFSVDESRCTRCGLCARDCVSKIIQQTADTLPSIAIEREEQCLKCQHCLAVCPSGAISILGKSPQDSQPINRDFLPSFDQMAHLVRSRRSIRHYKQENVDQELLARLLKALANVQTGANACQLTFTVIDDITTMRRFQHEMIAAIRSATMNNAIPERDGG